MFPFVPIFVIACIIVAVVVLASLLSGRHMTREAITAYISVLGGLAILGAAVAICLVLFAP